MPETQTTSAETWRPLTSDKHDWSRYYEVSDAGRVRRRTATVTARDGREWTKRGGTLKPLAQTTGRLQVSLTSPEHPVERYQVSRAVARAFCPDYVVGCHVHHLNGDPQDNRAENLACLPADAHQRHHHAITRLSGALLDVTRGASGPLRVEIDPETWAVRLL